VIVAQISDLHLKAGGKPAYGVADTASALKRSIRHINDMNRSPEVVLVTGDISDNGDPQSYELAAELLSDLRMPFIIIPGNHDQKQRLYAAFPEHRYLFSRIKESDGEYLCFCIEDYPIRLIGIDTVTPGLHGGALGPVRLAWLDKTLSNKPDIPTLIFMHHPPFASGIGHMDQEIFRGRHQFRQIIERHPHIQRLACGHIHRSISCGFGTTVATVCPGIGMQLVLDLRPEAPSLFVLEPPAVLLHCMTDSWTDESRILTHTSIVEETHDQYINRHPFFNVVSPM
jgi:3',5'-cyclic AMP phosphodiesterase CpdA